MDPTNGPDLEGCKPLKPLLPFATEDFGTAGTRGVKLFLVDDPIVMGLVVVEEAAGLALEEDAEDLA